MKPLAPFALCLAMSAAGLAVAETHQVTASQLPPAVLKAIQSQSGGKQPGRIERDDADGEVSYDVVFPTDNGKERTITVGEDGALLSVEVSLAETPAAVQKTILAQVKDGTLAGIDRAAEDGETFFDVEFTTKAGQERVLSVAEDGTLLSVEVALDETPPAVQGTIKTQAGDGKIDQIEKCFDDGVTTYEIGFTSKSGKERSFTVGADGRIVSVEVSLDEPIDAVQKTIRNKIGDGRILRLTETRSAKQTVAGYEVEAIVNGKAVTFQVGPKGKFLGMMD